GRVGAVYKIKTLVELQLDGRETTKIRARERAKGQGNPAAISEPHRHDDVLAVVVAGLPHQATGITIHYRQGDLLRIDRPQCILQVTDIEAYLDLIAIVIDLDFFLGLFLLRV